MTATARTSLPFSRTLPAALMVVVAAALLFVAGCASSMPEPPGRNWVSLERTAGGRDNRSLYVVTLFDDGHVLFEGYAAVKNKATLARVIPPEKAAAIFHELETVNIWERAPRYDTESVSRTGFDRVLVNSAPPPGAPWDILTARNHGRFKRIDGFFFAPHELLELKQHIEQAVGLADWVSPTPN